MKIELTSNKPEITGTNHVLPFDRLSPDDFERLCLWLVRREGYEDVQHLGAVGSEQGRDIVATMGGKRHAFQSKRVKAFSFADAEKEIKKVTALPDDNRPDHLVFLVTVPVSAKTIDAVRRAYGHKLSCEFWARNELDERVKRHQDIIDEFFQINPRATLITIWRYVVASLVILCMVGVSIALVLAEEPSRAYALELGPVKVRWIALQFLYILVVLYLMFHTFNRMHVELAYCSFAMFVLFFMFAIVFLVSSLMIDIVRFAT